MSLSNFLENEIVDHIFRARSYTAPATIYVALHTGDPGESGASSEVSTSGTNYARASLAASAANWKGTGNEVSGDSAGTGGQTKNAVAITFNVPSATWGTVTYFSLWDAVSAGNCLGSGALTTAKVINASDTVSFAADTLTVTFD